MYHEQLQLSQQTKLYVELLKGDLESVQHRAMKDKGESQENIKI